MVFPPYYFGQIAEARQQPGTVSYSGHMQLDLLQETTDEMARNGCKKVVIVNGHGGNLSLLPYFAQLQMQTPHDYVVYVYWWPGRKDAARPYKGGTVDMHAGESETAHTLVTAPGLVHMDRAKSESGADQARVHCRKDSTPASGGTPSSRITTLATGRWQQERLASTTSRPRRRRLRT